MPEKTLLLENLTVALVVQEMHMFNFRSCSNVTGYDPMHHVFNIINLRYLRIYVFFLALIFKFNNWSYSSISTRKSWWSSNPGTRRTRWFLDPQQWFFKGTKTETPRLASFRLRGSLPKQFLFKFKRCLPVFKHYQMYYMRSFRIYFHHQRFFGFLSQSVFLRFNCP